MLFEVLTMQRSKRFIIQAVAFFLVFLFLYSILDHLNMPYPEMIAEFGFFLVLGNIVLNIVMSLLSAALLNLSYGLVKLTGKEGKGSFLSFVSVIFGMLTYGCTPCVITFLSMIGISFFVIVLPLAGLPYKFVSLGLLVLGGLWLIYEIKHVKCKIKPKKADGEEHGSIT